MNQSPFDRLVVSLAAASRRHIVRLLAAGSAGGLGVAAGLADAGARRRDVKDIKKGKGKGKGNGKGNGKGEKCPRGALLDTIVVPANGATVETPVLKSGQRLQLRAVGFWASNATFGQDAFASFPFANANDFETVFDGVRLGLSVDGGSPEEWGSYNARHIYVLEVVGRGQRLTLRNTDPATQDNSGALLVDIFTV